MQMNTIPLPERPQLPVAEIAAAIQSLIDLLDKVTPDPDLEADGDEEDGVHGSEDEFQDHEGRGPGCPIADPDYGREEAGEPECGI